MQSGSWFLGRHHFSGAHIVRIRTDVRLRAVHSENPRPSTPDTSALGFTARRRLAPLYRKLRKLQPPLRLLLLERPFGDCLGRAALEEVHCPPIYASAIGAVPTDLAADSGTLGFGDGFFSWRAFPSPGKYGLNFAACLLAPPSGRICFLGACSGLLNPRPAKTYGTEFLSICDAKTHTGIEALKARGVFLGIHFVGQIQGSISYVASTNSCLLGISAL